MIHLSRGVPPVLRTVSQCDEEMLRGPPPRGHRNPRMLKGLGHRLFTSRKLRKPGKGISPLLKHRYLSPRPRQGLSLPRLADDHSQRTATASCPPVPPAPWGTGHHEPAISSTDDSQPRAAGNVPKATGQSQQAVTGGPRCHQAPHLPLARQLFAQPPGNTGQGSWVFYPSN